MKQQQYKTSENQPHKQWKTVDSDFSITLTIKPILLTYKRHYPADISPLICSHGINIYIENVLAEEIQKNR